MIFFEFSDNVHFIFNSFSLNSITCSGSLGIISARYLEHPFETDANVDKILIDLQYGKKIMGKDYSCLSCAKSK